MNPLPDKLNLWCGHDYRKGWWNVDSTVPGCDQTFDLNATVWPLPSRHFGQAVMFDVLEHLSDTVGALGEVYRVLRPGGEIEGTVPYWASEYAWRDPTHRRAFSDRTFEQLCSSCGWAGCGLELVDVRLGVYSDKFAHQIRNALPFRRLLRHLLLNMYDRIYFKMRRPL